MIISCLFLLRIRNVSDKLCRENQNIYFMFTIFSRKSCVLWDNVEKISQSRTCHTWQYSNTIYDTVAMLDATECLWSQNVLTFPQPFRILNQGSSCVLQRVLSFDCIAFRHGSHGTRTCRWRRWEVMGKQISKFRRTFQAGHVRQRCKE